MWGAGVYLSEHNVLTVILVIFDIGSVPTMWSSFFDLFQQCGLPSLSLMKSSTTFSKKNNIKNKRRKNTLLEQIQYQI